MSAQLEPTITQTIRHQRTAAVPLITVATITRNAAAVLELTIRSVLGQTYPNLEYLIIDGASTDNSIDIIRKFEGSISRWTSEPDRGISHALNKAAAMARGDAIIFMNSGDRFRSPEALSAMVAALDQPVRQAQGEPVRQGQGGPYDLRTMIVYGDSVIVGDGSPRLEVGDHHGLDRRNCVCHQSVLVGIDVQRSYRYDERLFASMDYDVWLRCLPLVPFMRVPVVVCERAHGGISSSKSTEIAVVLERSLVQLLHVPPQRRARRVTWFVWKVVSITVKHALWCLLGERGHTRLKTLYRPLAGPSTNSGRAG